MFKHYVRLINDLQPKVFVMENVSGMAKGKMKGKFIEIMKTLKALNYQVKCKKMNAMYYGVPQSRERLIFIGVRKDIEKNIAFPIPRNKFMSVKQALKKVEDIGNYQPITNNFIKSILHKLKPGESAYKYHQKGSNYNCYLYPLIKT